jgi:hypothetical protein
MAQDRGDVSGHAGCGSRRPCFDLCKAPIARSSPARQVRRLEHGSFYTGKMHDQPRRHAAEDDDDRGRLDPDTRLTTMATCGKSRLIDRRHAAIGCSMNKSTCRRRCRRRGRGNMRPAAAHCNTYYLIVYFLLLGRVYSK